MGLGELLTKLYPAILVRLIRAGSSRSESNVALQYMLYVIARSAMGCWVMPEAPLNGVLEDLKNSLRDLEKVRMTALDDPTLTALKRDLRQMIKLAEKPRQIENLGAINSATRTRPS